MCIGPFCVLNYCSKVNPELPRRRLVVFRPIDSEPFISVSSLLIIDCQSSLLSDDKTRKFCQDEIEL